MARSMRRRRLICLARSSRSGFDMSHILYMAQSLLLTLSHSADYYLSPILFNNYHVTNTDEPNTLRVSRPNIRLASLHSRVHSPLFFVLATGNSIAMSLRSCVRQLASGVRPLALTLTTL